MTGITCLIDAAARARFREQGYLVIPGVLDERQQALGHRVVAAMLTAEPPPAGHTGPYFLWPRFAVPGECGHDHGLLRYHLRTLPRQTGRPTAVIAHTVKGKGVSFMEGTLTWHYKSPGDGELTQALEELRCGA